MRPRVLFVLAIAAGLGLTSLRNGYPLPGATGQEPDAGAPGGAQLADSPTTIPISERASRECGLNSLFVLLRLSGHDVTYDQTREVVPVGPSGTSLLELHQAASRLGVKTAVYQCSMAELVRLPKPVIAYIRPPHPNLLDRPGHYVVVLTADESGVEALDSTFAASYKYPTPMWEGEWSGHILAPLPARSWAWPLALTAAAGIWVGLGLCCWRARVSRQTRAAHAAAALAQAEGTRP
jgi:hypothetical protein